MSFDQSVSLTNMGWGPEAGPWSYRKLSGSTLDAELSRLAFAKTVRETDCVSIQPCPNPENRTQDRYIVLDFELPGGQWEFKAVLDGHAGHETVDYLVEVLPGAIKTHLNSTLSNSSENRPSPAAVSDILVAAISEVDDAITRDIMNLFPGGVEAITKMSGEEIDAIVNDFSSGGVNNAKILRGLRGSTVLVSLVDPERENIWVASLGDCQAVLGSKDTAGAWKATLLSSNHNGRDNKEVERLRSEHPGEHECIMNDRVLGAIAVTRAIGDHEFKLPAIYTERVLINTKPGFRLSTKLNEFLPRNISPPYLSHTADVQHINLKDHNKDGRFLIMCSDGLTDLYIYDDDREDLTTLEQVIDTIVSVVGNHLMGEHHDRRSGNVALHLLRDAFGGQDEDKVSRMLTVEMTEKWMDDVTILVQAL